jgi:thymidylate kinase
MFIVFEGIDGSKKTTPAGRAADLFLSLGLTVHKAHPKEAEIRRSTIESIGLSKTSLSTF